MDGSNSTQNNNHHLPHQRMVQEAWNNNPQQHIPEFPINNSERGMEEDSLDGRVPLSQQMIFEPPQKDDIHLKIRRLNEKTQYLHADQQLLKQELKVRQKQTLDTFATLMERKKQLVGLISQVFNKQEALIDIGLTEEFQQLKKVIFAQQQKIKELKAQISTQGIAGVLTDESEFKMKAKAEQMVKEIKVGRKFSSTQYVRDYLQRPQAYKVSYEQSKYEYQQKVRIKQCLEHQKRIYQRKKEEINQLKRKQRQREQELLKMKDFYSR